MEREVHGGMELRSGQQHEKAAKKRQAESDFLRAYVAKHPNVYSKLDELQRCNNNKMHSLFMRMDEAHDWYPHYDTEYDRTEELVEEDPDTQRYQAELQVHLDLNATDFVIRCKINQDILEKMECAKRGV